LKIVIIAQYSPNLFPALHQIAAAFGEQVGTEVHFLSSHELTATGVIAKDVVWARIPVSHGVWARLPWFRSKGNFLFDYLRSVRPDWIIAQHEYVVPALAYRATIGRRSKVTAYFADYHGDRRYIGIVRKLAGLLNTYVDICDVRLKWRQKDWPRMRADPFIIRQAPSRRNVDECERHIGPAKVALTGSDLLLKMNRERLSRFLSRLCSHGITVDWYLPGPDSVRKDAGSLTSHPLFMIHEPVSKSELLQTLGNYDAGLFWAPMADADLSKAWDRSVFLSAASNKIGEYIAAGLVVAHTGNPGLSYLPDDVCAIFDPTDPEAGANQLAEQLADRATVERKRQAALQYHLDEMNFEAQAAPFIRYLMEEPSRM
jgi:hypothetical protein